MEIFINYAFSILYMLCNFFVTNIHNIPARKKPAAFFTLLASNVVIALFLWDYYAICACIIGGLILCIFSMNKIIALFFSYTNYLFLVCSNYILLSIAYNFAHLTEAEMAQNATYAFIISSIQLVIVVISALVFSSLQLKFLRSSLSGSHKPLILLMAFIATCLILFLVNITYEQAKGFSQELVMYNSIIFIVFFVLTAIFLMSAIKLLLSNEQLKHQNAQYSSLNDYTANLEKMYRNIREFKHEYLNLLLTMHFYIESGDNDSLRDYYRNYILPTKGRMTDSIQDFTSLKNLDIAEIKSLVYNKLIRAQELGYTIHVEVNHLISEFKLKTEIAELLGIYLDNAIDALADAPDGIEPELFFAAFIENGSKNFIVSNSFYASNIDFNSLNRLGYSTKGEDRGMGLYLANKILEKNKIITHNTIIEKNMFTQKLSIPCTNKEI
ncbi:MAG: GHKL domain-containing protein [Clostridium sp.]|nr:GHKL domain-containing protein [Clostridium sp.]MCM1398553.1 GHKL domain-containing protein [Clostridium sp.]MCM1459841.1 GHKL domain-containing protein [Bacteroides sp.]